MCQNVFKKIIFRDLAIFFSCRREYCDIILLFFLIFFSFWRDFVPENKRKTLIPIDDRHFGCKQKIPKKHWLLFLLLGTVLYWCIAGGQRADRKETARSEGGRRGRERGRARARAYAGEDEEARERGKKWLWLPCDWIHDARASVSQKKSWAVKEEGRWRDREKNR
jgi:hypothetical protein